MYILQIKIETCQRNKNSFNLTCHHNIVLTHVRDMKSFSHAYQCDMPITEKNNTIQ
jgi:hypothetical protein